LSVKIGINGFGRIGRSVARMILAEKSYVLQAVNDLGDAETAAYLLQYDSTHKQALFRVEPAPEGFAVNGHTVRFMQAANPESADFSDCDIVFECSGAFHTEASLHPFVKGQVKRVILSSMPSDSMPVYVDGISDKAALGHTIFSAGSCSTNALATMLYTLEELSTIEYGCVTSVHSYTNDQCVVDSKHPKGLRHGRAAAVNMIPVPTGVAKNLTYVMPHLADRLTGFSVRVPVPDVTMLDVTVSMQKSVTIDTIKAHFIATAEKKREIFAVDSDSRVSGDFVSTTQNITVALDLIQPVGERGVKLVAWLDNETGYAARLFDLISLLKDNI